MIHSVILTDADNTLWDTDKVYANAQTGLLSLVEEATGRKCPEIDRLTFVRRYDQALASRHHAHLKYPPMFLVWALVLGLDGAEDVSTASFVLNAGNPATILNQKVVDAIVQKYFAMLSAIPDLLDTVMDGLEALRGANATVIIVTEGKIEKQKNILLHHALGPYSGGVNELTKDRAQFERLQKRYGPMPVFVIGDQPDRDIIPAKGAGCITVLVPSRFQPKWQSAEQSGAADHVAPTFMQAVEWVLCRSSERQINGFSADNFLAKSA